ncbi:hypothetical protein SeMB42_g04543 [Synchytrium endobioticum]|uniref:PH domain-containing protein n=1 Tax=Synchytrium endobioticum TaxID=286115 RepID=A0A507CUW5_9FUNG|nr:hypothetical protein SeLEV6574_g05352 [Synchytrium endobioticum]TPX43868.1 hypothetical protein SeMB42_g04543 [Synchytrium endobioticum]
MGLSPASLSLYPEASAPPVSWFHDENDEPLPPYEVAIGMGGNHSMYNAIDSSSVIFDHEANRGRSAARTLSQSRQPSTTLIQHQPFARSRCSSASTHITNNYSHHMPTAKSLLASSTTRLYPSLSLIPELSPITAFVKEEWEPALDIPHRKAGPFSALISRARSASFEKSWRCARIEVKDGLILCSERKHSGSGSIWGGMENSDHLALMATFRLRHATIEPPRHLSGRDHCVALHLVNGHTAIISFSDTATAIIWKDGLKTEIACASAESKDSNTSLAAKTPLSKPGTLGRPKRQD